MIAGVSIFTVAPGTEIEAEGETLTVTETQAVRKGSSLYMTERQVAALKAHPDVHPAPEAS